MKLVSTTFVTPSSGRLNIILQAIYSLLNCEVKAGGGDNTTGNDGRRRLKDGFTVRAEGQTAGNEPDDGLDHGQQVFMPHT